MAFQAWWYALMMDKSTPKKVIPVKSGVNAVKIVNLFDLWRNLE